MTCHQSIPSTGYGWTPERRVLFLDRLAASGNARAACRAVGLSAEAAYRLRRRDPLFARAWAAAVLLGRDTSEQVLGDRAIEGIEEDVWYRGEVVGTRRRYDTRLLLAHLARLDALADEEAAGADAARFDQLLAAIGKGEGAEALNDRARFIDAAGWQAAEDAQRRELTVPGDDANGTPREVHDDEIDEYFGECAESLREDLEEICAEAEEAARRTAAKEWERRDAAQCAAVDACCERAVAQQRAAHQPPRLDPRLAVLMKPQPGARDAAARFERPVSPPPGSAAWTASTASTVSTLALAGALAGPIAGAPAGGPPPIDPPLSPRRGRNRRSCAPPRR